jgi:hypothetical protein
MRMMEIAPNLCPNLIQFFREIHPKIFFFQNRKVTILENFWRVDGFHPGFQDSDTKFFFRETAPLFQDSDKKKKHWMKHNKRFGQA